MGSRARAILLLVVGTSSASNGDMGVSGSLGIEGMKVRFEWPTHVLRGIFDRDGTVARAALAGLADDAVLAAAAAAAADGVEVDDGGRREQRYARAGRPVTRGSRTLDGGFLAGPGAAMPRRALEQAALLAHARYAALAGGGDAWAAGDDRRVENVRLHRFEGGQSSFELKHTSADPAAVSAVYVLRAPPASGDDGAGPELVLEDPRSEAVYFPALPEHLQPAEGRTGIWQKHPLVDGLLLLFPGGVPRQVPVTILQSELTFLTFDIVTPTSTTAATPARPPPPPSDAEPPPRSWDMIGAKGEPVADRSARVGRPYRLVLYRPQHATSSRATAADDDDDDGPPVAVEGVEDLVRWGTPVVWFRLPEAAQAALHPALLADVAAIERHHENLGTNRDIHGRLLRLPDGAASLFQTPGSTNLLNVTAKSGYPGLFKARGLVLAAVRKYLSATPDCGGLSGQALRQEVCAQTRAAATRWRQETGRRGEEHPGGGKGGGKGDREPEVWSSWLNVGGAGHRGISQMFHRHTAFKTAISGVYYPASGWAPGAAGSGGTGGRSTPLFLRSPVLADGAVLSLPTHTGTIILFPSWLEHSGDVHLGDTNRIVLAFNVGLEPECYGPTTGVLAPPKSK